MPLDEKIVGLRALISSVALEEFEGENVFRDVGNGCAFVGTQVDVWRLVIPPGAAASCAEKAESELWLADWAGGLLWIGTNADDEVAAQRIRAVAVSHGGHATLLRASESTRRRVPVFQPDPPHLTALNKTVNAAFDPLGIFNPGRMFEGV